MKPEHARCAVIGGILVTAAPAAFAYVGPGAGLGMIASLLAVVVAVLATIVGLVMWPIRRLTQRKKSGTDAPSPDADGKNG